MQTKKLSKFSSTFHINPYMVVLIQGSRIKDRGEKRKPISEINSSFSNKVTSNADINYSDDRMDDDDD